MIHIIKNNIKNLITHKTLMFLTVLISTTVIVFGMLFYSGYLLYSYYDALGDDVDTINIEVKNNIAKQNVKEIIEKLSTNKLNKITVSDAEISDMENKVIGVFSKSYSKRILAGKYYNYDEKKNFVILPEYMVETVCGENRNPIKQEITVNDEKLNVIGVVSYLESDNYEVPYQYYINTHNTEYIQCTYNENLNIKEKKTITGMLESNNYIKKYKIDTSKPALLSISFWSGFIQIFIIFLFMFINLFIIIVFWTKSNKRVFNIYSVVGATKKKINTIIVIQNSLILLMGNLCGLIIFYIFKYAIKNYKLLYEKGVYNYIFIDLMFYFVTVIILIFVTIKNNKEDGIYIIKE